MIQDLDKAKTLLEYLDDEDYVIEKIEFKVMDIEEE